MGGKRTFSCRAAEGLEDATHPPRVAVWACGSELGGDKSRGTANRFTGLSFTFADRPVRGLSKHSTVPLS